jgi:hypothetical protein
VSLIASGLLKIDIYFWEKVILDRNSQYGVVRTNVRLLHADPHLSCLQKLSVLTEVYYHPEKNITYVTHLIEHFISITFCV